MLTAFTIFVRVVSWIVLKLLVVVPMRQNSILQRLD